jgi:hypothetical protein
MRTNVLELAKAVDRKQAELDRAKAALLAALTGTAPNSRNVVVHARNAPRPQRGPGSDSIAARVLSLIQSAGPAGMQRRDLIDQLGSESAVQSALKKHSGMKRIFTDGDGTWRATEPRAAEPRAVELRGEEPVGQKKTPKASAARGVK